MKIIAQLVSLLVSLFLCFGSIESSWGLEKSDQIRVHVLDCGNIEVTDLAGFSDTGEYDGKRGKLNDPCFLIQHPKGLLLWDTGLGDILLGKAPNGNGPFRMSVTVSLASQLKQLDLTPNDITYISFSHIHFDHIGNATQFSNSTWLWQEKELAYFLSKPSPHGVGPEVLLAEKKSKKFAYNGDHDVFGDGRVKILSTPGHTPGHQSILIKLDNSTLILSGDLYHLKANREHGRIPVFNFSRAETLASMGRIETLAKNLGARVIIQHDPEEYASLPKFPDYLH